MKTLIIVVLITIALVLGIKAAISEEIDSTNTANKLRSEQQFQSELLQAIKHLNPEYRDKHYFYAEKYQLIAAPEYSKQYLHLYDNRYR